MAISARAEGTWAIITDDVNVAIPAGAQAGDLMVVLAAWKSYLTTCSMITAGYTEITEFADGTIDSGNGTGSMKVGAWYRIHDGSESNPPLVTANPIIGAVVMIVFQKGADDVWGTPAFATAAIASATNWTATASSDPGITAGDLLIELVGFRDNSTTMTRSATTALDATGITWTTNYVEYPATHADTTTGDDMSADAGYRIASSGTASSAPTGTGTLSASETGSALFIRLRVSAAAARVPYFTPYPQLLPH